MLIFASLTLCVIRWNAIVKHSKEFVQQKHIFPRTNSLFSNLKPVGRSGHRTPEFAMPVGRPDIRVLVGPDIEAPPPQRGSGGIIRGPSSDADILNAWERSCVEQKERADAGRERSTRSR
jgi:hypothetical protein